MGTSERQPETRQEADSAPFTTERTDDPFVRELVPGVEREIDQALERVIFLLARISHEREALERVRVSLDQSLDLLAEETLDIAWLCGLTVTDLDDSDLEQTEEILDPRHFYAAYIFDRAHERGDDVASIVEQAQQLGYPARYWWLSQSVQLRDHPDRLIVCVHHPSSDGDAGMDLYETLKEHKVTWDDLEAAALEEYRLLGKPIEGLDFICRRDGTALFPPATAQKVQKTVVSLTRRPATQCVANTT